MSQQQDNFLPAGKYYIGDPCYVVPDEHWTDGDDFCDQLFSNNSPEAPANIMILGHPIQAQNTAHGDGVYDDNIGNSYPVDAGLIGAVPVDLNENCDGMLNTIIDFEEDFQVIYNDGDIDFISSTGKKLLSVYTDYEEEDDNDDDDWGWDEDEEDDLY